MTDNIETRLKLVAEKLEVAATEYHGAAITGKQWANGDANTSVDIEGETVPSPRKVVADSMLMKPAISWSASIIVTDPLQLYSYQGVDYYPHSAQIPFNTSAVFVQEQFAVFRGLLRKDLNGLVTFTFASLDEAVAEISSDVNKFPAGVHISTISRNSQSQCAALGLSYPDQGGAKYIIKTTGVVNGVNIIAAATRRLHYCCEGHVKAEQMGVVYDGSDETSAIHIAQSIGPTVISSDVIVNSTYVENGKDVPLMSFNGSENIGAARTVAMNIGMSTVTGNDITNGYVGKSSKRHHLVGGVFRRDISSTEGSVVDANNWFFVNDATHIPANIDMSKGDNAGTTQGGCSLVNSGADLKIHFFGKRLNSLVITPDETFAKKGLMCGNSTGYDNAVLSFAAPCSFEVDLASGLLSDIDESIWGAVIGNTRFSCSISSSGFITVSHASQNNPAHTPFITYKPNSAGQDMFDIVYQATSGGVTTCFAKGQFEGVIRYNGGWSASSLASHDASDYTLSYDAVAGVLTVTHPTAYGVTAPTCQITRKIGGEADPLYNYAVFDETSTSFKVKILDSNGAVQAANSNMFFTFNRGCTARVAKSRLVGKLQLNIGVAQPLARDIDNAVGNFWLLGLLEH